MGNCTASKLGGGADEEAVSLCCQRKRLVKATVERRRALAVAHERYIHSLHAVAGAINLFVARHSAPSPALITLPSSTPPPSSSEPSFLRQTPTEPKTEALLSCSASSSTSSAPTSALREVRKVGVGCGYFFADIPVTPPSPPEVFGWDYFNPFEGLRAAEVDSMAGRPYRSLDEDLRAVREREGIPELEEEGQDANRDFAAKGCRRRMDEKVVKAEEIKEGECGEGKESGLTELEAPEKRMELLDALKDVEEEFIKAYESGTELARMLEANRISFHPEDDEIKENSSKFIHAITWNRSSSSLSSSSTSYLISSHKDISFTESSSELFDDYSGMGSGSHSQTIGRLYAWEKKLYEEVKVGEQTRKMYERKCLQLRNHDSKGSSLHTVDKSRAAAKELHARIWVALRSIETISMRIQKVRDEELQPQLIELLQGLMRTWRIMLQSHEKQKQIMFDVKTFTCPSYGRYCSDSQHQVTRELEQQLENWRSCFTAYFTAQRAYVEALGGWLSKCFVPGMKYYCRTRSSAPPYKEESPPLLLILQEWLSSLMKLPDRAVSLSMKGFINNMRVLLVKQGEEQLQKRKVDGLAKEFDQRVAALQKAENSILESKLSDMKTEAEFQDRAEYLAGRKALLDMFRQKLEVEKTKHQNFMQETTQATLNGFQVGLAKVFESMEEFSRDSLNLYTKVLAQNGTAKVADDAAAEKPSSCIEDSTVEVDNR